MGGVPPRTPLEKVTPLGSVPPIMFSVGAGEPVVVTVKLLSVPAVNATLSGLVIAETSFMVSTNDWVKSGPAMLCAVKRRLYVPVVPAAAVPLTTPFAGLQAMPEGIVPLPLSVGAGEPVATTVNVL